LIGDDKASYSDKIWSLSTLQKLCRRVDEMGSAVTRHAGSSRSLHVPLKGLRRLASWFVVLFTSQEDKPWSHSSHHIARQLSISATSVSQIAKLSIF